MEFKVKRNISKGLASQSTDLVRTANGQKPGIQLMCLLPTSNFFRKKDMKQAQSLQSC